ncbi:glycoside hydrolase family 45 protein [Cylindrobasidium torrendii FP15055 ss-10]|uniref:Glycoside hydrolase family 45 protein n=1 Tax=Cylindrobasidium torrendii FP15055 ss-10 TaxID=1314674 RepID=A0A0D7AYG1_9AGAR|nr:glycoside hydrolase family 45 protein [Cylindrobasidium torrendii FP15055 ss-10]
MASLALFKVVYALLLSSAPVWAWNQQPSGNATFTRYSGCSSTAACGRTSTGYSAALNQLAFGSSSGLGEGDACGRCFSISGTKGMYAPDYTGPFYTIVVKVNNLCPIAGNEKWCGQTTSNPANKYGAAFHFDICDDCGGATAFFPVGHTTLRDTFKEVGCDGAWSGSDGEPLWPGACLVDSDVSF